MKCYFRGWCSTFLLCKYVIMETHQTFGNSIVVFDWINLYLFCSCFLCCCYCCFYVLRFATFVAFRLHFSWALTCVQLEWERKNWKHNEKKTREAATTKRKEGAYTYHGCIKQWSSGWSNIWRCHRRYRLQRIGTSPWWWLRSGRFPCWPSRWCVTKRVIDIIHMRPHIQLDSPLLLLLFFFIRAPMCVLECCWRFVISLLL